MEFVHWTDMVDESKLSRTDRLALAVCRLDHGEWDYILGAKPEGYDNLPDYERINRFTGKRKPCQFEHRMRASAAIRSIIGDAVVSRFYWIYGLGRSEEEWFLWYISKDGPF